MVPDFGSEFLPTWAGRPAHMSAVDYVLWRRFWPRYAALFSRVYFDVAVGVGVGAESGVSESVRVAWERVTRPRIDVVGRRGDSWVIIELRGAAGPGAIGSLIVYRDLWLEDAPDMVRLELWLVTDVFPKNLVGSLEKAGIRLFLV